MSTYHLGALLALLIGKAIITTSLVHLDPGCFDGNEHCSRWAGRGYCVSHRHHMQETCPHSCDFCHIPGLGDLTLPSNAKSLAEPDFDCGRPVVGNGRRVARQIIFPDELQDFIRQKQLQRGGVAIMQTSGNPGPAVPVSNSTVADSFCGATLIHERFLVTAAHCVVDPENPVITVRLGELDFSSENETNSMPIDYQVERLIVHPDFNPSSLERYNDIALIQTVQKVQFNELVYPFCIPSARPLPNTLVTGSGFGFVNNTDRVSHLQEAELKIVDDGECETSYEQEGFGDELKARYPDGLQGKDVLCASFPERSPCRGDSGGPLFQDDESSGRRFLVGVVGLGISCRGNGISPLPGFYISIADHVDFINSVVYEQ